MKDLITNMVRSKYSVVFLVLFIGGLYLIQEKAIMPLVMSVVKSELFFEKPIEENEPLGKMDQKTSRTGFALGQCHTATLKEGQLPADTQFVDDNYEAWALGNRQYLIRTSVRVADAQQGQAEKLVACTVRMTGEDESKPESWATLAVDLNAVAGEGGN